MKIYLIRHGETTGDIEDRYGGDYEDHLTEEGKKQSLELGFILKDKKIEIIYNSPRIRAQETARIVAKVLGVQNEIVEGFRERNAYGILTGMIKKEAKEKYPEQVKELLRDKINHHVKKSEDYDSFKIRINRAFNKISQEKHDIIAIITHGGPISCIFREILKLGEFKKLGDCALIKLEKSGEQINLVSMDNAELENS